MYIFLIFLLGIGTSEKLINPATVKLANPIQELVDDEKPYLIKKLKLLNLNFFIYKFVVK